MEEVFQLIKETGNQKNALNNMQTRKELYIIIQYFEYEELDGTIAKTILKD